MITSKEILNLFEDYSASGKSQGRHAEIYQDPTSSDYQELEKSAKRQKRVLEKIRFIADAKNQKIYVADSYTCVHRDMLKILKLPLDFLTETHPYVKYGEAVLINGKLKGHFWLSSSNITSLDFNWTWLSRYIIL